MILTQTDRISRIVRTLIDFSRSGDNQDHRPVNVSKAVTDAIQLLELDRSAKSVNFENRVPEDLQVLGDFNMLTQVFINLLANARDASEETDTIRVDAFIDEDGRRHLRVTDKGSGIPPQLLDKVMDPFFTTKEPGEGTGLGLSLVYSIVRLHRGTLDIESPVREGKGSRITITLNPA